MLMNELVYVLAVEAIIVGAVCTLLIIQRFDIFTLPADQTWPVFSTSLQVLILNAHVLLLVCCFIAAGRFSSFAADVRDAFARSAGRLATATVLATAYVATLLVLRGDVTECVLCQLLGTSCTQPFSTSIGIPLSYTAYLAVLLPVAAFQTCLLIIAAGLCKEARIVPRRIATVNCALLLTVQVQKTLDYNISRLPARCSTNAASPSSASDTSPHVIILLMILYALDAIADLFAHVVLNGSSGLYLPVLFSASRIASLAAPWTLHPLLDDGVLPFTLLVAHTALAMILAVFDIGDVWFAHFATTALRKTSTPATPISHLQEVPYEQPVSKPLAASTTASKPLTAFEFDPNRRRRFVLSFNNKARWPVQHTAKKTA